MTSVPHIVLLVDDEVEVLDSLRRTLRDENYRILTTADPAEALRLLEAEPIDLVISDIEMPGMNGLELIARVRRAHPDIVRILLTGGASLDSALEAINQGEVYRYLTKPWDKAELRETIRQALDRLDELRRAAAADRGAQRREQLLSELEREHPGIGAAHREGGAYVLDGKRLTTLINGLPATRLRVLLE